LPLRNVGLMVLSRCCGRSGCRTARLLTSPAGRCEETPRTSQKTATPGGKAGGPGKAWCAFGRRVHATQEPLISRAMLAAVLLAGLSLYAIGTFGLHS
jgi:hypothetical protein